MKLQPGITRGSAYALIILFLVTITLIGTTYALNANAIRSARRSSASTLQLCQLGNQARAQQIHLWQFVVSISHGPPGETAAEKRQREVTIRAFEGYLHRVFKPRDCAMLGQHHG